MLTIETICPGCQRRIRVSSEHAGRQVRCPLCQALHVVSADPPAGNTPADPQEQWHLRTPEGLVYGPVSIAALDGWVGEGRVSDDCQVRQGLSGTWMGAAELYDALRPVTDQLSPTAHFGPGNDALLDPPLPTNGPTASASPASRDYSAALRGGLVSPHRGGIILALGIMGWAIGCPVFGVLAWTLGTSDLAEMRAGTMDAGGYDLTSAGRWIGMINTLVALLLLIVLLLMSLVALVL